MTPEEEERLADECDRVIQENHEKEIASMPAPVRQCTQLVYISGPYSADTIRGVVRNIRVAEEAAIRFWQAGYAVLCPHLNSSMLDGIVPYEQFIAGDLLMIERCDIVAMLPNWRKSKGAVIEHAHAERTRKEIRYL